MSKDAKNVPALRFKGYSDAWKKRKLGDLAEVRTGPFGSMLHAADYIESGIPIITTEHFKTGSLPVYKTSLPQVSAEDYHRLKSYKLHLGDLVFSRVGSVDINAEVFKPQVGWLISGRVLRVRPNSKIDSGFLHYYLSIDSAKQDIRSRAVGQTMPSINTEILKATKVVFTDSQVEQQKVSTVLNKIINLIAATQDKIDALEQAKKALLQRLFDQSWRFKGYSDPWEKRKLGDVAERVRNNDGRMNLPILTISAGKGWLTQRERFSQSIAGKELENYTLLSKGELSYNHGNSKLAKYGAVFALKDYDEALVPRVYHSFDVSGKADSGFVEYLFASKTPDSELRKLISSGARMDGLLNINYEAFMGISILLPSVKEQRSISRIIQTVSHLIAATQSRLSSLELLKKALLQDLFI